MSAKSVVALALLTVCGLAHAQLFKDPQWQSWMDAGRNSELEKAAQDRLRAQPGDAQATVALAMSAVDEGADGKYDSVAASLQGCVDKTPQAICHYGLGRVYGQQAMSASVFRMPGLASKTKEQFIKAVELDPLLYDARSMLVQFYLLAPGIAGGSVAKAKELAEQAERRQPEHAKLLRSAIASHGGDLVTAEKELSSVKPGDDKNLQRELRGSWMQLGIAQGDAKNWAKAKGVFEVVQRDFPTFAGGAYGVARALIELGQNDDAIKALERARGMELADRFPIDHRLGIALMSKGDKAAAKVALERFVANKKANQRNVDDAKKRLAELS